MSPTWIAVFITYTTLVGALCVSWYRWSKKHVRDLRSRMKEQEELTAPLRTLKEFRQMHSSDNGHHKMAANE